MLLVLRTNYRNITNTTRKYFSIDLYYFALSWTCCGLFSVVITKSICCFPVKSWLALILGIAFDCVTLIKIVRYITVFHKDTDSSGCCIIHASSVQSFTNMFMIWLLYSDYMYTCKSHQNKVRSVVSKRSLSFSQLIDYLLLQVIYCICHKCCWNEWKSHLQVSRQTIPIAFMNLIWNELACTLKLPKPELRPGHWEKQLLRQ